MSASPSLDYATVTRQALDDNRAALKAYEPPEQPALSVNEKADNLRRLAPATYLYGATATLLGKPFDIPVFEVYLSNYLQEAGSPTDPIERMLLEQLAWAHHVLGRLHVHAGSRDNVEEAKVYHAAAARLMGEFRRSALALQSYRQGLAGKVDDGRSAATEVQDQAARAAGENIVANSKLGNRSRLNGYLDHERQPATA
jgi:hypothetical protein